jgi:hypothetical protein
MTLSFGLTAHPGVALYVTVAEGNGTSSPTAHDWIAHHIPVLTPILPVLLAVWTIFYYQDKIDKTPGVAGNRGMFTHRWVYPKSQTREVQDART